jgi:hypothetical protein
MIEEPTASTSSGLSIALIFGSGLTFSIQLHELVQLLALAVPDLTMSWRSW